ncbi:MAG: hypothetical protein R3E66_16320 [bacterium]
MAQFKHEILEKTVTYSGEGISVRSLEEMIGGERQRQNEQVDELTGLRARNADLQAALVEEMNRLRELSDELQKSRTGQKSSLASMFSWLPWVKSTATTRRSIEDLLRRQFELSSMRLREAADFADRLEGAKIDLYDEIDRLNQRIIQSAQNEETAAAHVLQLRDLKFELEAKLAVVEPSTSEERQLTAELDRVRRQLAEHTTKLKLYSTAEDRLAGLKKNTRQLAETIAHLQSDITRYVTASSEKLDLVAGQIQAIGAAADAANVVLELKQSLDAMTESLNLTTRFVAETQAYFRQNVDTMMDDLELYDAETEKALSRNLVFNESLDDLDVENALTSALASQIDALEEFDEEVTFPVPEEVKSK